MESDRYRSLFSVKLILDILICVVAPDFGSGSASPLRFMGRLGSEGVMGRLGCRVGVSASYSYFHVTRKITTFIIREKFSRKIASIINYIFREFSRKITPCIRLGNSARLGFTGVYPWGDVHYPVPRTSRTNPNPVKPK